MRLTARPGGCRRCPRRPRPGLGRHQRSPDRNRGLRARPTFPRGSPDRRGRRSPPRTSGARGPVRRVPPRPGPARRAHSAQDPRAARALRVPPGSGRPRRGHRDPVRPGRDLPGRPSLAAHVPAVRGPARGPVTTPSARPRPAWARLLRPGPRVPFPASRVVPVSGPTAPAAQVARVARVAPAPAGAGQEARAVQVARVVPGRADSPVHAPVVPGQAR